MKINFGKSVSAAGVAAAAILTLSAFSNDATSAAPSDAA